MKPTGGAPMNATVNGLTYFSCPITLGAEIGIIDADARLDQHHEF